LVDRLRGGDRDATGGQIYGDALDAGDSADLVGHGALAVVAAHAGDLERGDADENAWRVFEHVVLRVVPCMQGRRRVDGGVVEGHGCSLRSATVVWLISSPPGQPAHTGKIAGFG
jgi:hypothetical protein